MNNATKTVPQILRDNICTVFNALNLAIAVALAAVGAFKNILFILIIFVFMFLKFFYIIIFSI